VDQAEKAVNQAQTGVTSAESQSTNAAAQLSSAEASLEDAKDTLTEAEDALAEAKEAAADLYILAPYSGVVTEVGIAVGETVSGGGGTASSSTPSDDGSTSPTGSAASSSASSGGITVASLETCEVASPFAEADAAALAVGQTAIVEFPAVPDVTAEGIVSWISPTGSTSNSVVTYSATITLNELPESIRLSQTATVTVVTAEAADVLTLPSNAVTMLSETEGTVELVTDLDETAASPETTTTSVEVGLQGDSAVEIVSGLSEGDTVVISIDTSTGASSSTTSEMGGFGGGTFNMPGRGAGAGPGVMPGGGGFPQ
jgi:macrolide-specific efflux system membrane fusion protein